MGSKKDEKSEEKTKEIPLPCKSGYSTSNEDTDDDAEDSVQRRKDVSAIIAQIDERMQEARKKRNLLDEPPDQAPEEEEKKLLALSEYTPAALDSYLRQLKTEMYELGLRETRELSRSKHLRIFGNNRRRATKRE